MPFKNSVMQMTIRSPFARRVRLAFLEHGVPFEERAVDVFQPSAELVSANPLGQVPVLTLRDGASLPDSHSILHAFYESLEESGGSRWWPKSLPDRRQMYRWSALAVGLCEKSVEYFLETIRPEGTRDPVVLNELRGAIDRVLPLVESALRERTGKDLSLLPQGLTQADLDMGTALAYVSFRFSPEWEKRFALAYRYLNALNERPSFQATLPHRS